LPFNSKRYPEEALSVYLRPFGDGRQYMDKFTNRIVFVTYGTLRRLLGNVKMRQGRECQKKLSVKIKGIFQKQKKKKVT
jgi:hypothetical protein